MRWGTKTLLAALAVLGLGAGLVACGGGDDSGTSTEAAGQTSTTSGDGSSAAAGDGADSNPDGKPKRDGSGGSEGGGSAEFSPKQHEDSGGGSEQFLTKSSDNSVQEFGGEAEGSEFDEAAAALHNFLDARAAGNWAAACEYLASSVTSSLQELATQSRPQGASCASTLGKLINPNAKDLLREEAAQADVGSVRVEGERAFVLFRGPGGDVLAMPMALDDGNWKVAAISGTPLS